MVGGSALSLVIFMGGDASSLLADQRGAASLHITMCEHITLGKTLHRDYIGYIGVHRGFPES